MTAMFSNAFVFNQDLSKWNTGAVTIMSGMFQQASSFNQDLSKWDTGAVTSMAGMFYEASSFNQDLSDWNTGSVTNMGSMFYLAVVTAKRSPHVDLSEENKHQKDVDDNIGTHNNKGLVQPSNSAVLKTTIKKTAPITLHPLG
jgi:surface protein